MTAKVAFVTGASSGIGRATAEAFVTRGYATVLADRDAAKGRQVEEELRGKGECAFIACDVVDEAQVQRALAFATTTYGRLDAAFNGAGINGDAMPMADGSAENWSRVIGVNLTGVWNCMRHEIPLMLKSGGGAIVNCASVAGMVGAQALAPYVASKHGVIGLTKAAAIDYARQNIRINAVCPGMTETPMFESVPKDAAAALVGASPIGRFGQPPEIAAAVLWLCDPGASFVTGSALVVDGGWTAQ